MVLNDLPIYMIRGLFFTILIETIFSFILKVRGKRNFLFVVLVNIMTNPIVVSLPVLFLVLFGRTAQIIMLVTLELLTVVVEGFVYSKSLDYKKINPYVLSLLLNIASYGIGEIINRLI